MPCLWQASEIIAGFQFFYGLPVPAFLDVDRDNPFDLFFDVMDFDQKTGAPTERCIKSYGLDWMLPALKKEGLY